MEITDENRATLQPFVNRFIDLANDMMQEGVPLPIVSSSLMTACATFATYVVAGNDGALRDSGVEKLRDIFAIELSAIQKIKIDQARREGAEVEE